MRGNHAKWIKLLPGRVLAIPIMLALNTLGCAELSQVDLGALAGLSGGALNESTVVSGLKEALSVGTQRATSSLSRSGGFSNNPLLRLRLPEELDGIASALRTVGMGSQVDALELKMNEAAERAAGEAVPVFASAIGAISVADAFEILNGEPTAATQYFQARTTESLRARFSPVVTDAMNQVGVYRSLQDTLRAYNALPFSKPAAPSVDGYITDRALSGLFSTLGEEEKKIREDPAARSSALLRRVFGSASNGTLQ